MATNLSRRRDEPATRFADRKPPPDLEGVTFVISGDAPAVTAGKRIARARVFATRKTLQQSYAGCSNAERRPSACGHARAGHRRALLTAVSCSAIATFSLDGLPAKASTPLRRRVDWGTVMGRGLAVCRT